jgi:hypothetical protein
MRNDMDELVKALKYFITRDLLYVVGGCTVELSFCYLFKVQIPTSPSTSMALLAAGIAYGIGYAIQDGLSLSPFVTTAHVDSPGPIVRWLYHRFVRCKWKSIEPDSFKEAQEKFTEIVNEHDYAQWNRIVSLKHIGSTLGSSWLVAGVLLVIAAFTTRSEISSTVLAAGCLILGIILLGLSWVKGAQQTQFVMAVYDRHLKAKDLRKQ